MENGTVVGDRFTVEGRAGSGGMAAVYRATDRTTGKTVALKLLHGSTPDGEGRFAREAELLARIIHPGIVGYIAHGTTDGVPYLAMRWVEGETLGDRLKRSGALGTEATVELGIAVTDALGAAHVQGVVHRDIKPGNLMIPTAEPTSRVLLLDFGIARTLDSVSPMTQPGMLVGTPGYVSPEQARASPLIDARSDVFSLGCVLYACLTGHAPFRGQDLVAVLAKILFQNAPHVRDERKDVHPELDALVARMMAKEPGDRFATARAASEALRALRPFLGTELHFSSTSSTGISSREARLCSMVIVNARAERGPEILADAIALATQMGGQAEGLANGGIAVKFVSSASASERALAAARCALTLRDRLPGVPVSLATVRSGLGDDEFVAEAIDRAAELVRDAPRSVRHAVAPVHIDEATAGLLDARFDVRSADGGLELFRELDGGADEARSLLGVATPCVGRERELAMLDATLAQVIDEGLARAVLVLADAGMGKSRLRQEWLRRVRARDDGIAIWYARADPMGGSSPFSLVRQAIRRVCEIHDDEALATRQGKLRHRIAQVVPVDELERVVVFVAELAGAPFEDIQNAQLAAARQDHVLMGDQLRRAWEDWIGAECQAHPVLLVLEDLHWSDPASLRLVDGALARASDAPLLVLGLARSSIRVGMPRLWAERRLQDLPLEELSKKSAERLARAVVGDRVPPATLERVIALANGNPFFLEELLRQVAEGRSAELPDTVLAIVEARLERFASEARRVLRAASIFGQTFWVSGLKELLGMSHDDLERWIDTLQSLDTIVPASRGRFADEREYSFRHGLVRDASYAMLPEADKALGHRVAATWLEAMGEQDPGVLSAHFEQGGEQRRAANLYRRASEQMLDGNELGEAIALAERGLRCGPDAATRATLHMVIVDAQKWSGNLEASARSALEVVKVTERRSDAWSLAVAAGATAHFKLGRMDKAQELLDLGQGALAEGSLTRALVIMGANLGVTAIFAGALETAAAIRVGLREAPGDVHEDALALGSVHFFEAFFADANGDLQGQVEHFDAAAECYVRVDHQRSAALAKANGAYARILIGDFERANAQLREALPVAEQMRLRMIAATIHTDLAVVLERLGRMQDARSMAELAISEQSAQGDLRMEGAARRTLAMVLVRQGELDQAVAQAHSAVELSRVAKRDLGHMLATLAYVQLKAGRNVEALEAAVQAHDTDGPIMASAAGVVMTRLVYARTLLANGHANDARDALRGAHAEVMRQASRLTDEATRRRFLERIWENAQTMEWARQSGIE